MTIITCVDESVCLMSRSWFRMIHLHILLQNRRDMRIWRLRCINMLFFKLLHFQIVSVAATDICEQCGKRWPAPGTTRVVAVSPFWTLTSPHFSALAVPVGNSDACGGQYKQTLVTAKRTRWKIKVCTIVASGKQPETIVANQTAALLKWSHLRPLASERWSGLSPVWTQSPPVTGSVAFTCFFLCRWLEEKLGREQTWNYVGNRCPLEVYGPIRSIVVPSPSCRRPLKKWMYNSII